MRNIRILIPVLATALFLGGCSDGTLETGGGAGDIDFDVDPAATALISPLVALYDLPENWDGGSSEAFLEILSPDAAGSASALLYRFNSFSNCFESRPTEGDVTKDPVSDRIFLDGILAFEGSVLSLSGTDLVITLFNDVNDIDGDGDSNEQISLQATRIDMMGSDLSPTC